MRLIHWFSAAKVATGNDDQDHPQYHYCQTNDQPHAAASGIHPLQKGQLDAHHTKDERHHADDEHTKTNEGIDAFVHNFGFTAKVGV